MIDRMCAGLIPAKPHTVHRDPGGNLLQEEMHTRGGFSSAFSYFYHRYPVTSQLEVTASTRGFPGAVPHGEAYHPLRRRLYLSSGVREGGQLLDCRVPLMANADLSLYLARPTESCDVFFANGDGDELWFVHEGSARLESYCGWLEIGEGDYVWIPRGLPHRWHLSSPSMRLLCFEAHSGVGVPKEFKNPHGQLMMDAPYTHRDFVRPVGPIATWDREPEGPRELHVKKNGGFTRFLHERPLMDVVGWDGFVYPWAFQIEKFQPKIGLVHLPPTIHTTFTGPGFLVCSFVPRVTDFHPQAIPCPYPHSSVDCDEVILYLRGNFTSRRGVGPGALSYHPAGMAHGPHPGAYEASIGTTSTTELAVMLDTLKPMLPTREAMALEDTGYQESWIKR